MVLGGGTLGGSGTTGVVTVAAGGSLAPGASTGTLTTGNLSFGAGATLAIELAGAGAGQSDRVAVTGTVTLGNASLAIALIGGFHPLTGMIFPIIANNGGDAVIGTFAGLGEGAVFTQGGSTYTITYVEGSGNDVALIALNDAPVNAVPGAQQVQAGTDLAIAGLSIADLDAGAATMTTTLSVAHGTLTVASAGGAAVAGSGTDTVTLTGTLAAINATLAASGNVIYRDRGGFSGTDTLTVDDDRDGALSDTDQVAINVNLPHLLGTAGDDTFTALSGSSRIDAFGGIDTITFNFKLTDATLVWSGNQVIVDGPSSHTVLTGFERYHFHRRHGRQQWRELARRRPLLLRAQSGRLERACRCRPAL